MNTFLVTREAREAGPLRLPAAGHFLQITLAQTQLTVMDAFGTLLHSDWSKIFVFRKA